MDYKVILAPRAVRDLQQIIRYIACDNPERARTFGRELIAKTKQLAQFPEMGRVVPEFDDLNLRELIRSPYRIVYRVNNERQQIEVARFWHGARGTPEMNG
ncbi:MAG TPA: type II toxin-antitoxin system RelE/ParE family toxin [Verrucomicrobiae bacterium]